MGHQLMKTWLAGETARVQTPRSVPDNIHVSLLAKAYAAFVGARPTPGAVRRLNPSSYAESPEAFTRRLRDEAAARLGLPATGAMSRPCLALPTGNKSSSRKGSPIAIARWCPIPRSFTR
jgi:hypothetical protein